MLMCLVVVFLLFYTVLSLQRGYVGARGFLPIFAVVGYLLGTWGAVMWRFLLPVCKHVPQASECSSARKSE